MIESELAANAGRGEHTPTPWFLIEHVSGTWTIQNREGGAGDCICQQYGMSPIANAAFIVKAVNSHAELVAALQACVRQLTELGYDGSSFGADAALEKAR